MFITYPPQGEKGGGEGREEDDKERKVNTEGKKKREKRAEKNRRRKREGEKMRGPSTVNADSYEFFSILGPLKGPFRCMPFKSIVPYLAKGIY